MKTKIRYITTSLIICLLVSSFSGCDIEFTINSDDDSTPSASLAPEPSDDIHSIDDVELDVVDDVAPSDSDDDADSDDADSSQQNVITEEFLLSQSDNIFFSTEVGYAYVWNGMETEIIGERGYITVNKADALTATAEDLAVFAETYVDNSGLNWFTIYLYSPDSDLTGICFIGSNIYAVNYGKLDLDGTITDTYGALFYEDGSYEYVDLSE